MAIIWLNCCWSQSSWWYSFFGFLRNKLATFIMGFYWNNNPQIPAISGISIIQYCCKTKLSKTDRKITHWLVRTNGRGIVFTRSVIKPTFLIRIIYIIRSYKGFVKLINSYLFCFSSSIKFQSLYSCGTVLSGSLMRWVYRVGYFCNCESSFDSSKEMLLSVALLW